MRVKLSQILFVCAAVVCLQACDSEGNEISLASQDIQNVNGRLVFKTIEAADKVLVDLSNRDESDLIAWEKLYNFKSIRSSLTVEAIREDTTLFLFSPQLATILNASKEYQVEDRIIWFHNNDLFKVPASDEKLLAKIKADPENEAFIAFKEIFIEREKVKATVNGRVLPSTMSTTTTFKLAGTLNYRFIRDFRVTNTGSNRQVELVNALQYQDDTNFNWYLAGETVQYRSIEQVYLNGVYNSGYHATKENEGNNTLNLTIYSNNSATPFSGSAKAKFVHSINSSFAPGYNGGYNKFEFAGSLTWY